MTTKYPWCWFVSGTDPANNDDRKFQYKFGSHVAYRLLCCKLVVMSLNGFVAVSGSDRTNRTSRSGIDSVWLLLV